MIQIGSLSLEAADPRVQLLGLACLVALVMMALWLGARRRAATLAHGADLLEHRMASELADSRARTETEAAKAREWQDSAQNLRSELAAARTRSERLEALQDQADELRDALAAETSRRIRAQEALHAMEREHAARLEELRGMKKEIEDRFSSVASGVLQKNSDAFLNLVSERFRTHSQTAEEDLERRREAIETLVKPLSERLGAFDQQIQDIEKARNETNGAIREQVKALAEGQLSLGQETRRLVQALRAPKTRGRWGEMQLRQVFEMAGMSENVDFHLEQQMNTDSGALRPDAIVHIPGGKSIVIDAKTPLEAYLDALESDTPEENRTQLLRHARHVREHVKTLASKAYQDRLGEAPDFVVMFIPGETFVAAAAEADPGLLEFAFRNRVLIASPTTLMALVKAIAYGWQQDKMAKNAAEVQRIALELHQRLRTFAEHVDGIGRALGRSVESYNKAVGSLESRVLPSVRKFEALGVVGEENTLVAPAITENRARVSSLQGDSD